ncbi:ATP-binding protein [Chitinimonas lacunae]|uniref:ATP-binding protein n=1 Tax=Chitinimonas lacunae TaxID=1963018 RepID=A0ABV8MNN2_9NEIS
MKRDDPLLPAAWPTPHPFGNERLWLDCLIEREILRLRARYALSLDELRGLYVSDRQVDELVRRHTDFQAADPADSRDPIALLSAQATQWREHFAADSPLALLGERLGLDQESLALVFVAAAPELDLRYETLYAYLNNDVTRKTATPDLVRRLLSEGDGRPDHALAGRLQALLDAGILERPEADPQRSALGQAVVASGPIRRFLLGIAPLPSEAAVRLEAGTGVPTLTPRGELLICRGDEAERQHGWCRQWLGRRGLHGLQATAAACLHQPELGLLARLAQAALVLRDPAGITREPATAAQLAERLRGWVSLGITILWLTPRHTQTPAAWADLPLTVLDLPPTCASERSAAWLAALRNSHLPWEDEALIEQEADALARRFTLGHEGASQAVRAAELLYEADPAGQDWRTALSRGARQQAAQALTQVAQRVETPHGWEQLVLPATTLQLLHEIAAAIAARDQVYRHWNMQGRTGRSAGLMLLFAGSSGTGKTMTASVLANHVGLDLFRVDLAGVVSKYIGETEKNLDRIFSAARSADALVLFDEADALLGKRAEVKDAHDRYANLEVAYLLQKMEEHDGVVILASNLPKNLDPAFSRRMHYMVEFAHPNAALREQLWRGMFPAGVPLADDIDYGFLAEQFDLSGGDIQTLALEAAFLAAGLGERVGMSHLMRAIARRQTKHGDPGVAARFRQHQENLERGQSWQT